MGNDISLSISQHLGKKTFEKLIKIIDDSYLENCSKKSKDQMINREIGAPIVRPPPSLKFGSDILIKR